MTSLCLGSGASGALSSSDAAYDVRQEGGEEPAVPAHDTAELASPLKLVPPPHELRRNSSSGKFTWPQPDASALAKPSFPHSNQSVKVPAALDDVPLQQVGVSERQGSATRSGERAAGPPQQVQARGPGVESGSGTGSEEQPAEAAWEAELLPSGSPAASKDAVNTTIRDGAGPVQGHAEIDKAASSSREGPALEDGPGSQLVLDGEDASKESRVPAQEQSQTCSGCTRSGGQ